MKKAIPAFVAVCLSFLSPAAFAIAPDTAPTSCFPENDLWKEDCIDCEDVKMTEAQFNKAIDEAMVVYGPIVKKFGATLRINRLWNDTTVNANAQKAGTTWIINMYGGLARRPETTLDGFSLVVLHELGHLLAGAAFYSGSGMSSEGNSDYWATQAGAKRIWAGTTADNAAAASLASASYKAWCNKQGGDANLCARILLAGDSLATLLATLNGEAKPKYSTPSKAVVSTIYEAHPAGQCRLDSYLAGLVCKTAFPTSYIPGLGADGIGYNTKASMAQAIQVSCDNRPKCWYASPLK